MSVTVLNFVRYGLPALLVLTGLIILAVGGTGGASMGGASLFGGAGLAVFMINLFYRFGSDGDEDRDREEAARVYLDEHGHWPDEAPR